MAQSSVQGESHSPHRHRSLPPLTQPHQGIPSTTETTTNVKARSCKHLTHTNGQGGGAVMVNDKATHPTNTHPSRQMTYAYIEHRPLKQGQLRHTRYSGNHITNQHGQAYHHLCNARQEGQASQHTSISYYLIAYSTFPDISSNSMHGCVRGSHHQQLMQKKQQ